MLRVGGVGGGLRRCGSTSGVGRGGAEGVRVSCAPIRFIPGGGSNPPGRGLSCPLADAKHPHSNPSQTKRFMWLGN